MPDREQLIELINQKVDSVFFKTEELADYLLENDVTKVIRCKDCKWYQEGDFLAPNKFCFRLKHPKEDRKIGYNYAPDDFCSYGELKELGK